MKKVLVCFVLFLQLYIPSVAKTVRFIQVTDVHLTQGNYEKLKTFVTDVNKNYRNIDFVVFTGDNIDKASISDLKTFLLIVKKIKPRVYVLVGNHDVVKIQGLDKALYMRAARLFLGRYHPKKTNFVFKKKGVVFIAMDGVKEVFPAPNGYYKEKETAWLQDRLKKYKNNKVVILQHFPVIEGASKSHNTYKREEYLNLLAAHNNVLAVVSGHFHTDEKVKFGNVYHIVTKNFSGGSWYKIIDIDTKESIIRTYLTDDNN